MLLWTFDRGGCEGHLDTLNALRWGSTSVLRLVHAEDPICVDHETDHYRWSHGTTVWEKDVRKALKRFSAFCALSVVHYEEIPEECCQALASQLSGLEPGKLSEASRSALREGMKDRFAVRAAYWALAPDHLPEELVGPAEAGEDIIVYTAGAAAAASCLVREDDYYASHRLLEKELRSLI